MAGIVSAALDLNYSTVETQDGFYCEEATGKVSVIVVCTIKHDTLMLLACLFLAVANFKGIICNILHINISKIKYVLYEYVLKNNFLKRK